MTPPKNDPDEMVISGRSRLRSGVRTLARAKMLWIGAAACAMYWLVAYLSAHSSVLVEFGHISRTSISLAVVMSYSSITIGALLAANPDRVEQLSLGIVLTWFSTVLVSVWALVYRLGGKPAWMLDSDIYGFLIFLQVLGGILHITAPGAVGGGIPRRNLISLGVACGLTVFVFLVLIGFHPDARHIVDALEYFFRIGGNS